MRREIERERKVCPNFMVVSEEKIANMDFCSQYLYLNINFNLFTFWRFKMLNNRLKQFYSILLISLTVFLFIITIGCNNVSEGNKKQEDNQEKEMSESLKDALESKPNDEKEGTDEKDKHEKREISLNNESNELIQPSSTISALQRDLSDIAERRIPAVVNIRSEVEVQNQYSNLFDFYDYFRKYYDDDDEDDENEEDESEDKEKQTQPAWGSGFIITEDGYIVTNHHVVNKAIKVTVYLANDREFDAEIVGTDEKTDTALLKIESENSLPTLPLGDSSKIKVGNIAVAIGNPFGLNGTFTMGVISATGRDSFVDRDASFKNYIQTDAPINQGNSGGPLLNIYGEVIGMNTAIYSTMGGGSIGIGFAVPINIVKDVISQLAEKGTVERPMLGLTVRNLDKEMAKIYGLEQNEGALVNDVVSDSPADIAGIKSMDVITKIGGEQMTSSNEVVKKVISYEVGDTVSVTVLRLENQTEVNELTLEVTLGLRDEKKFENLLPGQEEDDYSNEGDTQKWMGMTLGNLSDYKSRMKLQDLESGIVVLKVDKDSNAYQKGIRKGTAILSINGIKINNIEDLSEIKESDSYMVKIYIEGVSNIIVISKEE